MFAADHNPPLPKTRIVIREEQKIV